LVINKFIRPYKAKVKTIITWSRNKLKLIYHKFSGAKRLRTSVAAIRLAVGLAAVPVHRPLVAVGRRLVR